METTNSVKPFEWTVPFPICFCVFDLIKKHYGTQIKYPQVQLIFYYAATSCPFSLTMKRLLIVFQNNIATLSFRDGSEE